MATKTRRWETRVDAETDDLVARAAEKCHVTKSVFTADAARDRAREVLARADITWMDPAAFEVMIDSLDIPDHAPRLARLAAEDRVFLHD